MWPQRARLFLAFFLFFRGEREQLEREGDNRPINVVEKTCRATGVSKGTVMNIRKEAEAGNLMCPKKEPRARRETKYLDNFQAGALRRIIHNMYLQVRRCL